MAVPRMPIIPYGIQPFTAPFHMYSRFGGAFGPPPAAGGPLQPSTPTQSYPRQPIPTTPIGGVNPGPFPPGYGGGCGPLTMPPGCGVPASPEQMAWHEAARAMQCEVEGEQMRRGVRAAALDQVPQIPLGIQSTAVIPAGQTSTVALLPPVTPSVPLCLTRFEVPRAIAPFFAINSMRTARVELLSDGVGIPCDSFSVDAYRTPKIELPRLSPGTFITLVVTNFDLADHPFYATWWGIPLDQPGPCL